MNVSEVGIDALRYDDRGLAPAVVQDARDGTVLMLGYMNAEALARTMESGDVHFWSRSRGALWLKGETSGNYLRLVEIRVDCDGDALLVRALPEGPTCHTGERSCFSRRLPAQVSHAEPLATASLAGAPAPPSPIDAAPPLHPPARTPASDSPPTETRPPGADSSTALNRLWATIEARRAQPEPGSYTNHLLDAGIDRIGRKIGEESAETIIAAKNDSPLELGREVADLFYHALVLLAARGVSLPDVYAELDARHGAPRRHGQAKG